MARSGTDQYFAATIKTPYYTPGATAGQPPTRTLKDVNIMFSCPATVAEWLNIDPKYYVGSSASNVQVKAHSRTKAVIGEATTGTSAVAAYERSVGFKGRQGSKVAIISTGKETVTGGKRKATISFRFPQKATAYEIADCLGTVIPSAKIKAVPTASDVANTFRLKGGRRYGIMTATEATASTEATVKTKVAS